MKKAEPMQIDDEPPQSNVVRPEPKTVVAIPTKEPTKEVQKDTG